MTCIFSVLRVFLSPPLLSSIFSLSSHQCCVDFVTGERGQEDWHTDLLTVVLHRASFAANSSILMEYFTIFMACHLFSGTLFTLHVIVLAINSILFLQLDFVAEEKGKKEKGACRSDGRISSQSDLCPFILFYPILRV